MQFCCGEEEPSADIPNILPQLHPPRVVPPHKRGKKDTELFAVAGAAATVSTIFADAFTIAHSIGGIPVSSTRETRVARRMLANTAEEAPQAAFASYDADFEKLVWARDYPGAMPDDKLSLPCSDLARAVVAAAAHSQNDQGIVHACYNSLGIVC